jgi:hypothetical protein
MPRPGPPLAKTPDMMFISEARIVDRSSSTVPSEGPSLSKAVPSPRKRPRLETEIEEIHQYSAERKRKRSPSALSRVPRRSETHALLSRRSTVMGQEISPLSYRFRTPLPKSPPCQDQGSLRSSARHASNTPRRPLSELLRFSRDTMSSITAPNAAPEVAKNPASLSRQAHPPSGNGATNASSGAARPPDISRLLSVTSVVKPTPAIRPSEDSAGASHTKQMALQQNPISSSSRPLVRSSTNLHPNRASLSNLNNPASTGVPLNAQAPSCLDVSLPLPQRQVQPQLQSASFRIPVNDSSDPIAASSSSSGNVERKPMSIKDRRAHGQLAHSTFVSACAQASGCNDF